MSDDSFREDSTNADTVSSWEEDEGNRWKDVNNGVSPQSELFLYICMYVLMSTWEDNTMPELLCVYSHQLALTNCDDVDADTERTKESIAV